MEQDRIANAAQVVLDWLTELAVGEGAGHDGMVVFPVLGQADGGVASSREPLDYRTLEEAILEGWALVTEKPAATVPELVLQNRGKAMVLVLDGEEIIGGKQNRVVNASFLVAAGSEVALPVTCVEHGRWHDVSPAFSAGESAYHSLRYEKQGQVAAMLRETGRPVADQHAVWDSVARRHAAAGTGSATGAMHDIYRSRQQDIDAYLRSFPYVEGAIGLIVALNGQVAGGDIFDRPRTARMLWPKLVRSYALDALEGPAAPAVERQRAVNLLERTRGARCEVYPSLAVGEDVRFQGDGVVGAALVYQETPVHVGIFRARGQQSTTEPVRLARASVRRGFRDRTGRVAF
ncbi:MAG: hypothetical protein HY675_01540 [Chloroflexi bacterium]|nr:hypothetical protein [Chloroflexota bacterium]